MGRNKAHGIRQRKHVNWISKRYPEAWIQADRIRADRNRGVWPDWCYLPLARWWIIARQRWDEPTPTLERVVDLARLATLGAWRTTQGVYRFDPDLYAALIATPLAGDLADALLFRLPSWGVYLETPDLSFSGMPIIGVYASLEHDLRDGHAELRLLLDSEHRDLHLLPVPLRLEHGSLLASAHATHDVAWNRAVTDFSDKASGCEHAGAAQVARDLAPILALLLYLCADETDYQRPPRPRLVKTRTQGRVLVAPAQVRDWVVGERLGAAMRLVRLGDPGEAGAVGEHARPWSHGRRAHWHTFWTGSRDGERAAHVRWLPPIPVGLDIQDRLVVAHSVT
ncbi:hypothetical protein CCR95_08630 [Thiocystis minor]|uniref:AcrVA2 family anti-CRISPR protein n=1 Tax=Thiocystis minor TaxID=61597 RepID=UPI0019128AE0|nr:hypothetical protein [Thiocystis minor]MBK5964147.1 hypothetical protein [Thiocystis minor]